MGGFLLLHHELELCLLLTFLYTHIASKLLELSLVLEYDVALVSLVGGLFEIAIECVQIVGLGFGHELFEALESGVVLVLLLKRHAPLETKTFLLSINV